jgi:putative transposase
VKLLRPTHPYVAIAVGFAYVAVILDAWSRRVVGYAISRSIDARLAVAALNAGIRAVAARRVPADLPPTPRREWSRRFIGTTRNPYDNAQPESFMKTLKV